MAVAEGELTWDELEAEVAMEEAFNDLASSAEEAAGTAQCTWTGKKGDRSCDRTPSGSATMCARHLRATRPKPAPEQDEVDEVVAILQAQMEDEEAVVAFPPVVGMKRSNSEVDAASFDPTPSPVPDSTPGAPPGHGGELAPGGFLPPLYRTFLEIPAVSRMPSAAVGQFCASPPVREALAGVEKDYGGALARIGGSPARRLAAYTMGFCGWGHLAHYQATRQSTGPVVKSEPPVQDMDGQRWTVSGGIME